MAEAKRDGNYVPTLIGVSSSDGSTPVNVYVDPTTHRMYVDIPGGAGTVTDVSVVTANGFAGTVANSTSTPAITISTTITGITKGDGTALSAAVAGTDYTALAFKTLAVSGQSDIVADTAADTLTIVAGTNITLTTNAGTDTLTIAGPATTGFATVALDNLASVAINTTLLPGSDDGAALGSTTKNFSDLFLASGAVLNFANSNVVVTHTSGILTMGTGDLRITTAGTNSASVVTVGGTQTLTAKTLTAPVLNTGTVGTSLVPTSNDGAPLGDTTHQFSDLFLAEGGVINWDNGDATITQTGNVVALAGADLRVATAGVGTDSDSVPTLSSTSTLTNKTLTSPTITTPSAFTTGGTITLAENTSIALDPAGSADGKWSGITVTGLSGYTAASGAFGDLIYLAVADSRWEKTDADAVATAGYVMLGMMLTDAVTDGVACNILLLGNIRADAKFPALTVGAAAYVGESAGAIQVAIPTGADNVIRVVGFALTADEIYFNPSQDHQTTVA